MESKQSDAEPVSTVWLFLIESDDAGDLPTIVAFTNEAAARQEWRDTMVLHLINNMTSDADDEVTAKLMEDNLVPALEATSDTLLEQLWSEREMDFRVVVNPHPMYDR